MTAYEAPFTAADLEFIYRWSGGHPRMIEGICQVLQAALDDTDLPSGDAPERWQFHRHAGARLLNTARVKTGTPFTVHAEGASHAACNVSAPVPGVSRPARAPGGR